MDPVYKGTYAVFLGARGPALSLSSTTSNLRPALLPLLPDFCCLCQKDADGQRTDAEQALFNMALKGNPCISELYSHPTTFIFKVTQLPCGYPNGFSFPERFADGTICTPNKAKYFDRGWCFCESSIADLVKNSYKVLDLANFTGTKSGALNVIDECRSGRLPPMSPADFAQALENKSFTSKKADLDAVNALYLRSYELHFSSAERLVYSHAGWGDTEVMALCRALYGARELKELLLIGNPIGQAGVLALATCLRQGAAPKLESLAAFDGAARADELAYAELAAAIADVKAIRRAGS